MKKVFLYLVLILSLVLTLSACSSGSSTAENDAESEMEEQSDTVETQARKPVSDVVGGDGIEGTWTADQKADDATNEIVLALNSDGTYGIWIGDKADDTGESADSFDGTYTDNDSNLTLTPDMVDDAEGLSFGEGTYPYTLSGDTLTVKDDGTDLVFTRSE